MNLLVQRMKEYSLPLCPYQPAYDRVVVYMLPEDMAKRDTYAKDGAIIKPDTIISRDKNISPRGVLVGAGIAAMDHLRTNCIDLGHIVWVARFSPWRHVVERTTGGDVEFMFMRSSDIVGSEDVMTMIKLGKLDVSVSSEGKHHYVADGEAIPRFDPPEFVDT